MTHEQNVSLPVWPWLKRGKIPRESPTGCLSRELSYRVIKYMKYLQIISTATMKLNLVTNNSFPLTFILILNRNLHSFKAM